MNCRTKNNPVRHAILRELHQGVSHSQEETARILGISQQSVAETEQRALAKLRARLASDPTCNRDHHVAVQARKAAVDALMIGNPVVIEITASASDPLPHEITWMPAGKHSLTAHTLNGPAFSGTVICDEQAARRVTASFETMIAAGQRVWLDLDHDDGAAAGWVSGFSWDASRGIIAAVSWTPRGENALRGKEFFSFSPAFLADERTGRVAGLISGHAAGGLVNAPAFGAAMPALVAARIGGTNQNQPAPGGKPETKTMKELLLQILAALKVTPAVDATEDQLVALVAKNMPADQSVEIKALQAKFDDASKAAELAKTEAAAVAVQAKKDADAKLAEISKKQVELDAVQAAIISGANTRREVEITASSIANTIKGYALMSIKNDGAMERGVFFRDKIAPVIAKVGGIHFGRELSRAVAAFSSDKEVLAANSLGTLVGNLISQQSLALLRYEFPELTLFTTDFSDAAAKLNQAVYTRLKSAIAASAYSGTFTAADTTDSDVSVTIDTHAYAQVKFNANELGGTNRDLFGEQGEVLSYAIGKDLVDALYAKMVIASFPTTALILGTTGGGTGSTDGTGYNRSSAIAAAKKLQSLLQPKQGRFNLLNSDAFGGLMSDAAVVSLATYQKPEIITGYDLPPVAGLKTVEAVNLPSTANKVAFAGSPRALIIATRIPNDYTTALSGSSYGNVSTIKDPNTGMTVMQTAFVDHATGTANLRLSVMRGVAVGDPSGAVITVHA